MQLGIIYQKGKMCYKCGIEKRSGENNPKYGFNISNIKRRIKRTVRPITFGFMGRIIYTKGVHLLCEAFCKTQGDAQLVIWGDANNEYG